MGAAIRAQFPGCPPPAAREISSHTARRGSGRVGRSAAGWQLRPDTIRLAVVAHIRHAHTRYDELLMSGAAREEVRRTIAAELEGMLQTWEKGEGLSGSCP